PSSPDEPGLPSPRPTTADRLRRRRRMARLLAVAALACALAAGYFGLTIVQLRGVERTWRRAMAVDAARAAADRRVLSLLDAAGDDSDDAAARALGPIGGEATTALGAAEVRLQDRRILDRK